MKQRKRLLFYLLLNVLVSASTTAAVLWGWQRFFWPQRTPAIASGVAASPGPSPARPQAEQALVPYQVQPGDDWQSIAAAFHTSVENLQRINGLETDAPPGVGQVLLVPGDVIPPTATPQLPAGDPQALHVIAVVAPGDLPSEYVQLEYSGTSQLPLQGWQIRSPSGEVYTFPALILHANGAIRLHTAAGLDTVVDLYWGLDLPQWGSGQEVALLTPEGSVQETFRIP